MFLNFSVISCISISCFSINLENNIVLFSSHPNSDVSAVLDKMLFFYYLNFNWFQIVNYDSELITKATLVVMKTI